MRSLLAILWLPILCWACSGAPKPAADPRPSDEGGAARAPAAPASARASVASADGKTAFRFALPAPGSERIDRESFALGIDVVLTEKGKRIASERNGEGKRMVRHTTVLAHDGRAITKKKVRYETLEKTVQKGEREARTPSPLTGKTYLVSLSNGKTVLESEAGQPVSEVEAEALLDDNKEFGKPPQFATFVPKHALSPGEKFTPPEAALAEMFGGKSSGKSYGDVEFTFVGTEVRGGKPVGRFDFRMTIEDRHEGGSTVIQSKCTVLLLVDGGWPVELTLAGDVKLDARGQKPGQVVSGSGKLEMKLAAEYP